MATLSEFNQLADDLASAARELGIKAYSATVDGYGSKNVEPTMKVWFAAPEDGEFEDNDLKTLFLPATREPYSSGF